MKITFISLLLALSISGCFESEAPKCSDEDVRETVKSVYVQVLDNIHNSGNILLSGFAANLPKTIVKMNSVRAISYDEVVKLRTCRAEAVFDTNQTANIEFTVQLNEENSDEFYVDLDTEFVEGLMQQSLMQGMFDNN